MCYDITLIWSLLPDLYWTLLFEYSDITLHGLQLFTYSCTLFTRILNYTKHCYFLSCITIKSIHWVHDLIIFIEYRYMIVCWIIDFDMALTVIWIFSEYGTRLFLVFLILIWHSCYLDIPATDLRCVKLSAKRDTTYVAGGHLFNLIGATSRISRLMDLIPHASGYPVTRYYCCFCVVKYNKYNMGWEKWTIDYILSSGCSWIHIHTTTGDGVILPTNCI